MSSHKIRWTLPKIERLLQTIAPTLYRRSVQLGTFRIKALSAPNEPFDKHPDTSSWDLLPDGTPWGPRDYNFLMATSFQVPSDWPENEPIVLFLPIGDAADFSHPEALVYIDGVPYAACDRHHQEIYLPDEVRDGQRHALLLHGWTGGISGDFRGDYRGVEHEPPRLLMKPCFVAQVDSSARAFYRLANNAWLTARDMPEDFPAKHRLLNALNQAFNVLDSREPLIRDEFYESLQDALEVLEDGIERSGKPLELNLYAAGHAHIDVAWLWTLDQVRQKAGRTFHTQVRLMEDFSDFTFTQSQPQLYDYIRQDYPALFETIKAQVQAGQWEPIGGMWVEADCNLSGAESLARQFVLGRQFFTEHFGKDADSPILWLPDVFGYAWNLPQLIKLAGLEYFFTIKIGWNQYNKMPYESFWWQGIDGTQVLTHFSTSPERELFNNATYNSNLAPRGVLGSWLNMQQKEAQTEVMMSYGYGDGGGGPTREMLENAEVLAEFPGMPHVRFSKAIQFFRDLDEHSGDILPVWNGELYLEYHRGTYTSQSRNKRANRKSEFLLHDVEFLAVAASLLDAGYEYPQALLTELWQLVCLNQFHDIIPGSSIQQVYIDSLKQYHYIADLGVALKEKAVNAIGAQLGGSALLINPSYTTSQQVLLYEGDVTEGQTLIRKDTGEALLTQVVANGLLVDAGTLEPYAILPLEWGTDERPTPSNGVVATPELLENAFIRVEINKEGDITRIFDKVAQREVLAEGAIGNQWIAFEDRPMNWDAWDVDIFYNDKSWLSEPATSIQVLERGALRGTVEIRRQILNSPYVMRISLEHHARRVDFDVEIDWVERHIFLKTAFPVNILAPKATYEIQWGHVERPTHHNTSWDWARFETCAQKWVDLAEDNYGVALLNDCKYGHDIYENVMRISLLRAPTSPDPEADQGHHHFSYRLLPHDFDRAHVIREAYALNDPAQIVAVVPTQPSSDITSFKLFENMPAVVETVKRAEDGNGFIVRLYQSERKRGQYKFSFAVPVREVYVTNLLETDETPLPLTDRAVTLSLNPFQIVTLRLVI